MFPFGISRLATSAVTEVQTLEEDVVDFAVQKPQEAPVVKETLDVTQTQTVAEETVVDLTATQLQTAEESVEVTVAQTVAEETVTSQQTAAMEDSVDLTVKQKVEGKHLNWCLFSSTGI
jgi:hypothetical protein